MEFVPHRSFIHTILCYSAILLLSFWELRQYRAALVKLLIWLRSESQKNTPRVIRLMFFFFHKQQRRKKPGLSNKLTKVGPCFVPSQQQTEKLGCLPGSYDHPPKFKKDVLPTNVGQFIFLRYFLGRYRNSTEWREILCDWPGNAPKRVEHHPPWSWSSSLLSRSRCVALHTRKQLLTPPFILGKGHVFIMVSSRPNYSN